MDCPSCQRSNPDTADYCGECGSSLRAPIECPRCGEVGAAGQKFCHGCGQALAIGPPPSDYTPRHLAERILASKSALEGERKQVTVLFADVKGSMELAEGLDPEVWHGIVDRFLGILAEGVHRFEGTVNQYTGDGIMAIFGAPIAHEDHAQRACYAALHLTDALREHSREVRRDHGLDFGFRMGLNSGEVVVGKIGDDLRMDYTAQGHTVGLAQRMESLAEANSCFVSPAVAELVSGYFELEPLGDFRVKGVREPVAVSRLEGVGKARSRFDVSRSRGLTRFVGRADDSKILELALERARAGRGQVIGVVAEAGVGKSRLCFEFMERRCRAEDLSVVEGHAVAHGRHIPFVPILEMLRGNFAIGERDDDATAREKIAGRLLLLDDGFRDVLPVLFEFLGVADPARPAPRMDPEARQRQLFGVLRRLLQQATPDRPGVCLIEDLHWLDGGSEAWLADWVDAIPKTHNLLIVNFRPEYRADWMQRSHYQQLALGPLGPDATRELLEDRIGRDPSTAALAEAIHARTGGNPFFSEELVRALIESGCLEGQPGHYRLGTAQGELPLPSSVQTLLASRIDRQSERDKQVLQTAAVIGRSFSEKVLARVAGLAADQLAESLAALRSAEFLYEESLYPVVEYSFKHPLTQAVALESQLHERRARTHGAIADAIQQLEGDDLDERAALLAHHCEGAGDLQAAAGWHARAADWVMASDMGEAERHWTRVREILADEAGSPEARALQLEAHIQLLNLNWRAARDPAEGMAIFEQGLELAQRAGDDRALSLLHANLGLVGRNPPEVLARCYRESVRYAERSGDPSLLISVGSAVSPYSQLGHLDEALERVEELTRLAETTEVERGDLYYDPVLWLRSIGGYLMLQVGRVPEATAQLDEALARVRRRGDAFDRLLALWYRSISFGMLGDREVALDCGRGAFELAQAIGATGWRAHAGFTYSLALSKAGRSSEAIQIYQEADQIRGETGIPALQGDVSDAYLALGRPEDALRAARNEVEAALRGGSRVIEIPARLALARVLIQCGEAPAEIEALIQQCRERVPELSAHIFTPYAHEAEALLAMRSGQTEVLERAQRAAIQSARDLGAPLLAERFECELRLDR
jgi:adenylate cyclase